MKRNTWVLVLVALLVVALLGQVPAGTPTPEVSRTITPDSRKPATVVELSHMRVDLHRREVIVRGEVCDPSYVLEFLLSKWNTKEYESLLRTRVCGADLHAALLMLGLTSGIPARWSQKGESVEFVPPRGARLRISLRWKDKGGQHESDAGQWLANPEGKSRTPPETWIFVGPDVLPDGAYWADATGEGGMVSRGNVPSAVIDVPFESGASMESRQFVPNKKTIPAPGTPVEIVIAPLPGAERCDYARAVLKIDRLGVLLLGGNTIGTEQLRKWGREYLSCHSKGQVVIRVDPRATVWDLQRTREILRESGVIDIRETYLNLPCPILPRTRQQARESLRRWKEHLSDREGFRMDPPRQIASLLEYIEQRHREVEQLLSTWDDYADELRATLESYRRAKPSGEPEATSRPSVRTSSGGEKK